MLIWRPEGSISRGAVTSMASNESGEMLPSGRQMSMTTILYSLAVHYFTLAGRI